MEAFTRWQSRGMFVPREFNSAFAPSFGGRGGPERLQCIEAGWVGLRSSLVRTFVIPQLDVGKLVGAASAPAALIIATSIGLGNLRAKYGMLAGIFRETTREYRSLEEGNSIRRHSLQCQMELYSSRLRLLMRGTLWLTLALHSFILTVVCTGIGVIFPKAPVWAWITAFFSFAGLFLLAGYLVIEMMENHRAKDALMLETAEFPSVHKRKNSEDNKASFVDKARS